MKKKKKQLTLGDMVRFFDGFGYDLHVSLHPVRKTKIKGAKKPHGKKG